MTTLPTLSTTSVPLACRRVNYKSNDHTALSCGTLLQGLYLFWARVQRMVMNKSCLMALGSTCQGNFHSITSHNNVHPAPPAKYPFNL